MVIIFLILIGYRGNIIGGFSRSNVQKWRNFSGKNCTIFCLKLYFAFCTVVCSFATMRELLLYITVTMGVLSLTVCYLP